MPPDNSTSSRSSSSKNRRARAPLACDACKRRKIRCVPSLSGGQCGACASSKVECTFGGAQETRVVSKDYIEDLEMRLRQMEELVQSMREQASPPPAVFETPKLVPALKTPAPSSRSDTPCTAALDSEDEDYTGLSLLQEDSSSRSVAHGFYGNRIDKQLVREAIKLEVEDERLLSLSLDAPIRRPECRLIYPWETSETSRREWQPFVFPPPDLLRHLVDLYFACMNVFFALLHRPTFESALASGLHYSDERFARVVLLVCAVGSRHSRDTRVTYGNTGSWASSGWAWFSQVDVYQRSVLHKPSLYNLQAICLYVLYMQGCSLVEESWPLVGIAIRLVQSVGAHRRKVYGAQLTVNDELWKRAFWCLIWLDRMMGFSFGRPCAVHEEDIDLDLPIECDDEYWICPETNKPYFQQPKDKPSKLSFFVCIVKLNELLGYALRTVYSINKTKVPRVFVPETMVTEFDSLINNWMDSVPAHLRWDPNRNDETFFAQSATLMSLYHHFRILSHHPFVPSGGDMSAVSQMCILTCVNAARSCAHISDVQIRRMPNMVNMMCLHSSFASGIVLLLKIFTVKRTSSANFDFAPDIHALHACMRILDNAESRIWWAGKHRDILHGLASAAHLPRSTPPSLPSVHSSPLQQGEPSSPPRLDTPSPPSRPDMSPRSDMQQDLAAQPSLDTFNSSLHFLDASASTGFFLPGPSGQQLPASSSVEAHLFQPSRQQQLQPELQHEQPSPPSSHLQGSFPVDVTPLFPADASPFAVLGPDQDDDPFELALRDLLASSAVTPPVGGDDAGNNHASGRHEGDGLYDSLIGQIAGAQHQDVGRDTSDGRCADSSEGGNAQPAWSLPNVMALWNGVPSAGFDMDWDKYIALLS